MGIWNWLRGRSEARGAIAASDATGGIGVTVVPWTGALSLDYSGSERVTIEQALTVPAVWAAVNFLAATMASLPVQVFRRTRSGRKRDGAPPAQLLRMAPNPWQTSYDWRHMLFTALFTEGRALAWIERDSKGYVVALWPLPLQDVTIRRAADRTGRVEYIRRLAGRETVYQAEEVIDLAFLRKPDGIGHWGPIERCAGAIRQAINAQKYALTVFGAKGIPPFVIQGPFQSGEAARRAADDVARAAARAMADGRPAIALPGGHEIKRIMDSPEAMQLVETQRFAVEQIARVYGLPPVFLQDLMRATFSNAEQQDLHFVKHALRRWVVAFEQELTLKVLGGAGQPRSVKLNLDGLLRGDFASRMQGHATAIQHGIMTPNEARALEDREPMPGGDELLIQGATVPLGQQTQGAGNG